MLPCLSARGMLSLSLVFALLWSDIALPTVSAAAVGKDALQGLGRKLNEDHDRQRQANRQQALIEKNRQRGEAQNAFLVCPEGLMPCRVARGDETDLSDDSTGADIFEVRSSFHIAERVLLTARGTVRQHGDGGAARLALLNTLRC